MGWSYSTTKSTKAEYIRTDVLTEFNVPPLKTALRGDEFWMLLSHEGGPVIVLALLQKGDDGCWGHKIMGESEHPYCYNVPKAWLKLAPVRCQAWRDLV